MHELFAARPILSQRFGVGFATLQRMLCGAAVSAALALGGCASVTNPFDFTSAADKSPKQSDIATGSLPQTELQKATEYWGKQYDKNPKDAQAAVNYVRNLKALGAKTQALAVIEQVYSANPANKMVASEYGRLALEQDQVALAERLLMQADDPVRPDWKITSARGTVLAKQGKYRDAIPLFERALQMAPGQPSVLNNLALAYAMDGRAEKAEPLLRQASADQTADPKVGYNLALVLGLQGKSEDAKSVIFKNAPPDEINDDATLVKQMVGAPATAAASISTGSTTPSKPKPASKSAAKAKLVPVAEDPAEAVRRLADGYSDTPADAPVKLTPGK